MKKILCLLLVVACTRHTAEHKTPAPAGPLQLSDEAKAQRAWWITKAAKALHHGAGPASAGEVDNLAALGEQEIIDALMNDDKFYDGLLDFNLYFLGFKDDRRWFYDRQFSADIERDQIFSLFSSSVYAQHIAINGVQSVRSGGNILDMIKKDVPIAIIPFNALDDIEQLLPAEVARRRGAIIAEQLAAQREASAFLKRGGEVNKKDFCDQLADKASLMGEVFKIAPSNQFAGTIFLDKLLYKPSIYFADYCSDVVTTGQEIVSADDLSLARDHVAAQLPLLTRLASFQMHYDWDQYFPEHVIDLKFFDQGENPLPGDNQRLVAWDWFWKSFGNTSSNYNRKRAAYVFKRFFCDDLTPVSVVAPDKPHESERHASDPSCQSCHFKLDPLAGFFKGVDARGRELSRADEQTEISFSDGNKKNYLDYQKAWASKDAQQPWSIGYIRSLSEPELNTYAAHPDNPSFGDLLSLVRDAPETRNCLVKRAFEYFVGDQQAVDAGFLQELADQYRAKEVENPAQALKDLVRSLVASNTFKAQNPNPQECYDTVAGTNAQNRPPCAIAFVVEKYCLSCHNSGSGGLNLATWPWPDYQQTLQKMSDRLAAADPLLRMPLNRHMSDQDRVRLYLWLQTELRGRTEPRPRHWWWQLCSAANLIFVGSNFK